MTDEAAGEALGEQIFPDGAGRTFALLDGASVPDLPGRLHEDAPDHVCLFRGSLEPDMAEVAPYLVELEPNSPFSGWVLEEGWGSHWGVFAVSDAGLRALRRHFRTFTMVRDPEGKLLYFRYYDPRVLRAFLPMCNEKEMNTVFGPVGAFVMESRDPDVLLRFTRADGSPQCEEVPLARARAAATAAQTAGNDQADRRALLQARREAALRPPRGIGRQGGGGWVEGSPWG